MKISPKFLLRLSFLATILALTACTRGQLAPPKTPTTGAAPVPAEYKTLYAELDKRLDEFADRLNSQPKAEPRALTFATELIVANSNRGEELLKEQTYQGVLVYLDRLQALGVRGVKVAIKYPLLSPEFPRSNEYLAFYKKVAGELKRRKMTMLAGTGVVFTDPAFSSVPVNYRGMTLDRLKQVMRQNVETIIGEIQPDYITVANEPSTETQLTGVPLGVQDFTGLVNFILNGLDRQGVLVGAGAGNWDDPAYIESLAKNTALDYIDLHIYPVNRGFLARAVQEAEVARANNKRVIIGETWLYKAGERELGGASAAEIISRDVFSFWQPLDAKFLTQMVQFARQEQAEFMSPFWSKYFFGYADYNRAKGGLAPAELLRAADPEISTNVLSGTLSQTGLTYQKLATGQ